MRRSWLIAVLLGSLSGSVFAATDEEQRCRDLGPNCVCSEPLNTNVYDRSITVSINPADSTRKQCDLGFGPGFIVDSDFASALVPGNSAEALAALPGGHSVQYYMTGPNPQTYPSWFMGHNFEVAQQYTARASVRWYLYSSPGFTLIDNETVDPNGDQGTLGCSTRLAQTHSQLLFQYPYGFINGYNFFGWNPSVDCCPSGPGIDNPGTSTTVCTATNCVNTTPNIWEAKWYRFEMIMTNRNAVQTGAHFRLQIWVKNVTDNGPNRLAIDTDCGINGTNGGCPLPYANPRIPFEIMNGMTLNLWRHENWPGQCKGYRGVTHLMVAGWDNDSGQMIGPAAEVETGEPPTPIEICGNGIDDDGDGLIDEGCAPPGATCPPDCPPPSNLQITEQGEARQVKGP